MNLNLNILKTIILRKWIQSPLLPIVLVLIIAVGVATFFSVRLANKSAVSGFKLFTESLTGESDFTIRSPSGLFSEETIIEISKATGHLPIYFYPIIETSALNEGQLIKIVGIDLVSLANFPSISSSSPSIAIDEINDEGINFEKSVFLTEDFLSKNNLSLGDQLKLNQGSSSHTYKIKGTIVNSPFRPTAPSNLVLMDIRECQNFDSLKGKITSIQGFVPEGGLKERVLNQTRSILTEWAKSSEFIIESAEDQKKATTEMSSAFRLNLTILSCLALMVGTFFILQSMEASIIRRRGEIAILRSLGIPPSNIFKIWLTESLMIGFMGSLLGVLIGFVLAQAVVRAVVGTVNQLYYEITSSGASMDWGEASLAIAFGIIVSLVAGYLPSREAAKVEPASAAKSGSKEGGSLLFLTPRVGLLLLAIGYAFAFIPPLTIEGKPIALGGYLSALFIVTGWGIFSTMLFPIVTKMLPKNPSSIYTKSQFRNPKGRHRLAVAALVAAFGMSSAMGILIASFDKTLNSWISQVLRADVYIASSKGNNSDTDLYIPPDTWSQFLDKETEGMDLLRQRRITFKNKKVWLAGTERNTSSDRKLQLSWINKPKKEILAEGDTWISEPMMRKFSLSTGNTISIPTPVGYQNLTITGVYADYSNETGTVMVNRRFMKDFYNDNSISNAAIYLNPQTNPDEWVNKIQKTFPNIFIRTNKKLRNESLEIFEQTFSVTYALESIAILIAVIGLGLTMTGLLLERKNELINLRQIGTTRSQIAKSAMLEGLTLSIVGSIGGIALSLSLGWLLIYKINVQSFGWTLSPSVPTLSIFSLFVLMLTISSAVSWLVGKKNAILDFELTSK